MSEELPNGLMKVKGRNGDSLRPKIIFWFRIPDGSGSVSYRFKPEEADRKVEAFIKLGYILIPNPFRKGVPPGGYKYETRPMGSHNGREGAGVSDQLERTGFCAGSSPSVPRA